MTVSDWHQICLPNQTGKMESYDYLVGEKNFFNITAKYKRLSLFHLSTEKVLEKQTQIIEKHRTKQDEKIIRIF